MRGEDKPYELPPLNSTDEVDDVGNPMEGIAVKGRGGTPAPVTAATTPIIPLGPPPAVVSLAQGIAVAANKQQTTPPPPPQINLSRLQPEPPQPPSSGRSRAAGPAKGGRRQTAPASVIAVAEAASLAGVATVVIQPQPQPPPTSHPRPPPVRHIQIK